MQVTSATNEIEKSGKPGLAQCDDSTTVNFMIFLILAAHHVRNSIDFFLTNNLSKSCVAGEMCCGVPNRTTRVDRFSQSWGVENAIWRQWEET